MSFEVAASAYDRFMGRYSAPLAPALADLAAVEPGRRVLDVGCGPGALTAELVQRVGPASVSAVDLSESFVAEARRRHPGVDVHQAPAERLPFGDDAFDAALAQLVVHFMADPVAGLREMGRVTRTDGIVAACVWTTPGAAGRSPSSGRRSTGSTPTPRTSRSSRAPAKGISGSSVAMPACGTSRTVRS